MVDKSDDLIIQVAADTAALRRSWAKVESEVNGLSNKVNRRFHSMGRQIDKTFENVGRNMVRQLTGPLAGIGSVLAVREVARYADSWTEAGNKIAAAGSVVGMAGRSLEDVRKIADDSRAGFNDTVQLYSRLLRSAGDVANSENEVARATEIVNRAFKAGGAAASEMSAGVLQLSQGLASGLLQGDELRSVRENAPLLADAIADYFGTTIGGLKKLGAEGELTSDKIFKAILSAGSKVDRAFATTNATIADSVTRVQNALTQYIGSADQGAGATVALNAGLSALADNFDQFADITLKVAAIIAGALVGRSIMGMVSSLGVAGKGVIGFTKMLAAARAGTGSLGAAFTSLGVAAGPIALIVGGTAALAVQHFAAEAVAAKRSINEINDRIERMGLVSEGAADGLIEAADATDKLAEAERKRRVAQARGNVENIRNGTFGTNVTDSFAGNADQSSLFAVIRRAQEEATKIFNISGEDRQAYQAIERIASGLRDGAIAAKDVRAELQAVAESGASQEVIDLADSLFKLANSLQSHGYSLVVDADTTDVDAARDSLDGLLQGFADANASYPFTDEQRAQIKSISDEFDGTTKSAEETLEAILDMAEANPSMAPFMSQLISMTNRFVEVAAAARDAKADIDAINDRNSGKKVANDYVDWLSRRGAQGRANLAFLSEQERVLALTKEQRDLESEIIRVKEDAADAGAKITDAKAKEIALARIARAESEKASNKKDKESPEDKFKKAIEEQRLTNINLQEQLQLQASLNPLIDDHGYALAKLTKRQEMENEAIRNGLELTTDRLAAIDQIAEAYALVTTKIDESTEANRAAAEAMQEWFDLGRSATRGFIDDLIEGKTAAEALGNVFNQLGSKLIDLGLSGLFGSGGGDFGVIGKLFGFANGGVAANGRPKAFANGGVSKSAAIFGEAGPEAAVPLPDGRRIPVDLRMPTGMGSGPSLTYAPQIDARGADSAAVARLEQVLARDRVEFEGRVKRIVSRRSKDMW